MQDYTAEVQTQTHPKPPKPFFNGDLFAYALLLGISGWCLYSILKGASKYSNRHSPKEHRRYLRTMAHQMMELNGYTARQTKRALWELEGRWKKVTRYEGLPLHKQIDKYYQPVIDDIIDKVDTSKTPII